MSLHPLAGMPVPASLVVNIPDSSATISAFTRTRPTRTNWWRSDVGPPGGLAQGHLQRGSHPGDRPGDGGVPAGQGVTGPLFLGIDTHALSEPAFVSALEVFAANGVEVRIQRGRATRRPRSFPTPS